VGARRRADLLGGALAHAEGIVDATGFSALRQMDAALTRA